MFVSDPVRQVAAGELPGPPPTELTQTAVGLAGDGAGACRRADDLARLRTQEHR